MFEGAVARERSVAFGEVEFFEVFGYYDGVGREEGVAFGAEQVQSRFVFCGFGVGRIEEDEVDFSVGCGETFEGGGCSPGFECVAAADSERGQIGADGAEGGLGVFDEDGFCGASAEGLYSHRSGASVEVEEYGAGDARGENVEEGFAEAVAGGASVAAFGRDERSGAELSGDDAHRDDGNGIQEGTHRRGIRGLMVAEAGAGPS